MFTIANRRADGLQATLEPLLNAVPSTDGMGMEEQGGYRAITAADQGQ